MREDYFRSLSGNDFDAMLAIVKSEMGRIFGDIITKKDKSLDNREDFNEFFEDYQQVMTEESFKSLVAQHGIELQVTPEMIAQFVFKIRNGSFGFDTYRAGCKLWVNAEPVTNHSKSSMCLIDSDSIQKIEERGEGIGRINIVVTTLSGDCYKVNKYSIPKMHAKNALIEFMNTIKSSIK